MLARLAVESSSVAAVARKALQIMHFNVEDDGPLPSGTEAFEDQPQTACVAACYRCLMSYYNQPDHELLDRRDEGVQAFLLRLASAQVQGAATLPPPAFASGDWATAATARGVPPADSEPLSVDGDSIPLVWRRHYVVAVQGGVSPAVLTRLGDLGFEVIHFDQPSSWPGAFERLRSVLGRPA